ncbi:ABC transporter G family member 6-like [Oppia nitens]|uniref:ABC transporter G family member 6-like n=1 Tax=Oppia nitens TaxID=1686743 RepID=UPI0023DA31C3|nr:ABC transporter G family member 6-like [Oppia nitens]
MGPSGAGKTTLLKCLNGRLSMGGLSADSRIYLSRRQPIESCFVGQHAREHLIMCLTVRQNMLYASKLKNTGGDGGQPIDHEENVRQVLRELTIDGIANTIVAKCSGGQQKRLTIAVEMTKLVKPNVLCIDEPTTGLDSVTACAVMECLKSIGRLHRIAIITSIHQPNNEIVYSFDKLYVLAKGGNCIFDGPPERVDSYLDECNIICDLVQVPVEQLLKLASIELSQEEYIGELLDKTRETSRLSVLSTVQQNQSDLLESPNGIELRPKRFRLWDVWHVMHRTAYMIFLAQWQQLAVQFAIYNLFSLIMVSMFNENVGKPDSCYDPISIALSNGTTCVEALENDSLIFQNPNLLFFSGIIAQFIHMSSTCQVYLVDIKIFISEHHNSWYSTGAYFWGKSLTETFMTVLMATEYATLVYLLSGQSLDPPDRLLWFVGIMIGGFLCSEGLAHCIGIALVNYGQLATIGSILFYTTLTLFSNFYIIVGRLPPMFRQLSDFVYLKYQLNGHLLAVYGLDRCPKPLRSIVLRRFAVSDIGGGDDQLVQYVYGLAVTAVVFKLTAFVLLLAKTNLTNRIGCLNSRTSGGGDIDSSKSVDNNSKLNISVSDKEDEDNDTNSLSEKSVVMDMDVDYSRRLSTPKRRMSLIAMASNFSDQKSKLSKITEKVVNMDNNDSDSVSDVSVVMDMDVADYSSSSRKTAKKKRRMSSIISLAKSEIAIMASDISEDPNSSDVQSAVTECQGQNQPTTETVMAIAWTDLTLTVSESLFRLSSSTDKTILRQLNGYFEFPSLNALMGPSGAGKTSLLKCINGLYSENLTPESSIYVSNSRRLRPCYIVQDERERMVRGLTARQAMTYASRLKNPDIRDGSQHEMIVLSLMLELSIYNTLDTPIDRLSGGELKRLVIGMELVSSVKPNLLCIDEPTSGLDSSAAETVIQCIQLLSRRHQICAIASIHQPSNEILMLFDKLYVMAAGGQVVYADRPGDQLKQTLAEVEADCQPQQLPIETLLGHCCLGRPGDDQVVKRLTSRTRASERKQIDARSTGELMLTGDGIRLQSKRFLLADLRVLIARNLNYLFAYHWMFLAMELTVYLIVALILRLVFSPDIALANGCANWETDDLNNTCAKTERQLRDEDRVMDNTKYLLFVTILTMVYNIILTTFNYSADFIIFFNEHRNGWYSAGTYYWAHTVVEIIPSIIIIIVFSMAVNIYSSVNSNMVVALVVYLLLGGLTIQSVGHIVGLTFMGHHRVAVFTSVAVFILYILFCNFFIPLTELHYSIRTISNLNPLKLTFESLIIHFYGFDRCLTGQQFSYILYMFDLDDPDYYFNTNMLVVLFLVLRSATMVILLLTVHPMLNTRRGQELRRMAVQMITGFKRSVGYGSGDDGNDGDYKRRLSMLPIPGLTSPMKFVVKHIKR